MEPFPLSRSRASRIEVFIFVGGHVETAGFLQLPVKFSPRMIFPEYDFFPFRTFPEILRIQSKLKTHLRSFSSCAAPFPSKSSILASEILYLFNDFDITLRHRSLIEWKERPSGLYCGGEYERDHRAIHNHIISDSGVCSLPIVPILA